MPEFGVGLIAVCGLGIALRAALAVPRPLSGFSRRRSYRSGDAIISRSVSEGHNQHPTVSPDEPRW